MNGMQCARACPETVERRSSFMAIITELGKHKLTDRPTDFKYRLQSIDTACNQC